MRSSRRGSEFSLLIAVSSRPRSENPSTPVLARKFCQRSVGIIEGISGQRFEVADSPMYRSQGEAVRTVYH